MNLRNAVLFIILSIVVGFTSVSVLNFLYRGDMDILRLLKEIPLIDYVIALLIFLFIYPVEGLRLWILLKIEGYGMSYMGCVKNNVGGYLMAYLTPSGTGGQPYQVYHMSKMGVDSAYATSLMAARFVEITFGNASVALLTLVSGMGWISSPLIVFAGIGVNISLALLVLLVITRPSVLTPILRLVQKILKYNILEKYESWGENLRRSTVILWSKHFPYMLLDILGWFTVTSLNILPLYYLLERFTGEHLGFFRFFGAVVTVSALAYFTPTPGSSGGIEAVYQMALSPFYGAQKTLPPIFAWRLVSYYIQIPIAFVILIILKEGDGGV